MATHYSKVLHLTMRLTALERERRLKTGGYRIQASLDVTAQAAADKNVAGQVGVNDRDALLLAGVEPGSGRVRALAANRRFKVDDAADPENKPSSDPGQGPQRHPRDVSQHDEPAADRRRRHHGIPGRLGLQDVHHGGGAGERLPARVPRS
jgi:hypothetical protein